MMQEVIGVVYGLDFGTTNSLIAWREATKEIKNRKLVYIGEDPYYQTAVRSAVLYAPGLSFPLIGYRALVEAEKLQKRGYQEGKDYSLFTSFKKPEEDWPKQTALGEAVSQLDLMSHIFQLLREKAEFTTGKAEVKALVCGAPVGADEGYKRTLAAAAAGAGLIKDKDDPRWHIMSEPIAAALDYGVELENPERVLMFDLGGGTLDVSILDMQEWARERKWVIEPHKEKGCSSSPFAGDWLTQQLFHCCIVPQIGRERLAEALGAESEREIDEIGPCRHFSVFEQADHVKISLSTSQEAVFRYNDLEAMVTREQFVSEVLSEAWERHYQPALEEALNMAEFSSDDIETVLLAGGSSQIPFLGKQLVKMFPGFSKSGAQKVRLDGNPFEAIAGGLTAIVGPTGFEGRVVEPLTQYAYGIWDFDRNRVAEIIPKGTPYSETRVDFRKPDARNWKRFRLVAPHYDVELKVYRLDSSGQRKLLGEAIVPLGRMRSTDETFRVGFQIYENTGELEVGCFDEQTGKILEPSRKNFRMQ